MDRIQPLGVSSRTVAESFCCDELILPQLAALKAIYTIPLENYQYL